MRNSKVNCKLSKTDILDTVSSLEVTLEWKTLSGFLKDLISTFALMLLNFLRKLVLYFHDIYRQSGQNQANTRSSVKKILYLLDFDQIVYISWEYRGQVSRKHVFWSKKFVLSDTNSLEQFADGPEVGEFT